VRPVERWLLPDELERPSCEPYDQELCSEAARALAAASASRSRSIMALRQAMNCACRRCSAVSPSLGVLVGGVQVGGVLVGGVLVGGVVVGGVFVGGVVLPPEPPEPLPPDEPLPLPPVLPVLLPFPPETFPPDPVLLGAVLPALRVEAEVAVPLPAVVDPVLAAEAEDGWLVVARTKAESPAAVPAAADEEVCGVGVAEGASIAGSGSAAGKPLLLSDGPVPGVATASTVISAKTPISTALSAASRRPEPRNRSPSVACFITNLRARSVVDVSMAPRRNDLIILQCTLTTCASRPSATRLGPWGELLRPALSDGP
jgi:hypothetical protein